MMNKLTTTAALLLLSTWALAADSVVGFWKTIDDETHEPKSIVQLYEYQGKLYGRVVDLLKDKQAKAALPGSPAILGLDIIWDLTKKGDKYRGGEVLDPQKGRVYDCQIWLEGDKLILSGSLFGIGRKQVWLPAKDFKGGATSPTPRKPRLK